MKVTGVHPLARALVRAGIAAAILASVFISAPATAQAITRAQVIARAKTWVAKKVPYSQSRYYRGYRQDCSGFVSMSWALGKSYTTRTISSRATRVPISKLQPGDAVLQPGHVSIFAGWKNKSARTYYALEETTWGSHAKRRVRTARPSAKGLRLRGITSTVAPPRQRVASSSRRAIEEIRAASYRRGQSAHQFGQFARVALTLD